MDSPRSRDLCAKALPPVAMLLSVLTSHHDGLACGGLFCSAANPVNQAAERIIFSKNGDETITAVIEILYEGEASKFAWVLPVPAGEVAKPAVASKVSFDRLDQASNPTYTLIQAQDESCDEGLTLFGSSKGDTASAGVLASPRGGPQVDVVAKGTAGPYDWVQIEIAENEADRVGVAIRWLTEAGYDVGATAPDTLAPYVNDNMNLLAFKLTKGDVAGAIRPISITYKGDQPFIPIRPTAVAANEDMGVKVWVLGEARAVPQNGYLSLELNESLINWFNPNSNYNDVVIRAANEAGGFGFVTEQAGPAGQFSEFIYNAYEATNWNQIQETSNAVEALELAIAHFGEYDGMDYLLNDSELVPLREGSEPGALLACFDCYFSTSTDDENEPATPYEGDTDPIHTLNREAFTERFYDLVIKPLEDTRALFDNSNIVTRLYTTMSPDEMVVDPSFDTNPDLPTVNNVHSATQVRMCDEAFEWRVELSNGMVVEGHDSTWPLTSDDEMPANRRMLQMGTRGEGEVVEDNTGVIKSRLADLGFGRRGSGFCSLRVGAAAPAGTWLVAGIAAIGLLRRLRRRR